MIITILCGIMALYGGLFEGGSSSPAAEFAPLNELEVEWIAEYAPYVDKQTAESRRNINGLRKRIRALEKEVKRLASTLGRNSSSGNPRDNHMGDSTQMTVEATAYTARCEGCIGITKTGIDVRQSIQYDGKRIIAVDPRVIPLGSTVEITLTNGSKFVATAQDTGGAIKGKRIDVLVSDKDTAKKFGRQTVKLRIVSKGEH